jgi:hypothetical protein
MSNRKISKSLEEVEPFLHKTVTVLHLEHPPNPHPGIVGFLLGLEEGIWSATWHKTADVKPT